MKKKSSITLLIIISVIMAVLVFFTFASFEIGIKNYNSVPGAIETEYDISGGTAYTLTLSKENEKEVSNVNEVVKSIENRLQALGYEVYKVTALKGNDKDIKDYDIRIETRAPLNDYGSLDEATLESDIGVIIATGELKFFGGTSANPTEEILSDVKVIEKAEFLGQTQTTDGSVAYASTIKFTKEAYEFLEEKLNEGAYYFSFSFGETKLFDGSTAISKDYFSDRAITISTSSEIVARQTILQIEEGSLEYEYEIAEVEQISSPYGNVVLPVVIIIATLLLGALIAFVIKYKGFALSALFAFVFFVVVYLWMFILIPGVKLNIGGLIGMVIASIVMVDGLVIILKRIKEEHLKGKTVKFAVQVGQKRAIYPIITTSVFAGVLALALFLLATGALKGFAIALGVGVAVALIANLVVVRAMIKLFIAIPKNKEAFFGMKKVDGDTVEA